MRDESHGSGPDRHERNRGRDGGESRNRGGQQGGEHGHDRNRHGASGGRGPGSTDWNFGPEMPDDDERHGGGSGGAWGSGNRPRQDHGREGADQGGGQRQHGDQGQHRSAGQGGGNQRGGGSFGGYEQSDGFGSQYGREGGGPGRSHGQDRNNYGAGDRDRQGGMGGYGQSGYEQSDDERGSQHFQSGQQREGNFGYGPAGQRHQQGGQQQGGQPGGQNQGGGQHQGQQSGGQQRPQRGQHTGKGPKGYQRSDDRIREDVCEQLAVHGEVDASDIEIEVSSGEVTLSGTVNSREEKRHAEDIAERCSGVKDVQNRLRVKARTEQQHAGDRGQGTWNQGGMGAPGSMGGQGGPSAPKQAGEAGAGHESTQPSGQQDGGKDDAQADRGRTSMTTGA